MKRKTKVLASLLGVVLLVGPGLVIYDNHGLRGDVQLLEVQQEATQKTLIDVQEEATSLKIELNESQAVVTKIKDLLAAERMKAESLQESLTSTQDAVAKLRGQKETLQVENAKLKKASSLKVSAKKVEQPAAKLAGRGGSPTGNNRTIRMRGTAYTNNDAGMNGKGITATGTKTAQGRTVAVDQRVIPLGSKLHITSASYPGINGTYIAEDTGSAIKGHKIDVYFVSKSVAAAFGVRNDLVVTILK